MPVPEEENAPQPVSARMLGLLRGALMALSALMVVAVLIAARKRLHFAFEYDWIEDGMLASMRHIRSGLPLYTAPSVYFTPYLYTPLYLYLSAALSKWTGISYATLRLVSIASTLGCFGAIYALVFSETRRHFTAFAAVGFFAACYPVVEGNFDIGRVDMLWIFFVMCAFYATRRMHPLVAALLWVCAFQTKQGVLPIALLALCADWQRPRRVLMGVGGFVAMLGLSIAWLTYATDGWYHYYVFGMAGSFGYNIHAAAHFIPADLLSVCGIALLLAAGALLVEQPDWRRSGARFYVLGTVGMVVFTGYIRGHRGANTNSLIPAYAWIAVLFGVALGRLYIWLERRGTKTAYTMIALLLITAMAQLMQHYYSPAEYASSPEEDVFRRDFETSLRSIPGDVLVLSHPEDGLMAGKTEYAGSESIGAVIDAKQSRYGDALIADYADLIHSGKLSAVALDMTAEQYFAIPRDWIPRDFLAYYPLRVAAIGGDARRFTSQPRWIYLPCPAAGAADIARMLDAHVDEAACAKH